MAKLIFLLLLMCIVYNQQQKEKKTNTFLAFLSLPYIFHCLSIPQKKHQNNNHISQNTQGMCRRSRHAPIKAATNSNSNSKPQFATSNQRNLHAPHNVLLIQCLIIYERLTKRRQRPPLHGQHQQHRQRPSDPGRRPTIKLRVHQRVIAI